MLSANVVMIGFNFLGRYGARPLGDPRPRRNSKGVFRQRHLRSGAGLLPNRENDNVPDGPGRTNPAVGFGPLTEEIPKRALFSRRRADLGPGSAAGAAIDFRLEHSEQ
jgi:hypothetical protein